MTVRLEAGKTYTNGWGDRITIIGGPIGLLHLFRDHVGYLYYDDGVMARYDMDHRFNLVSTGK